MKANLSEHPKFKRDDAAVIVRLNQRMTVGQRCSCSRCNDVVASKIKDKLAANARFASE